MLCGLSYYKMNLPTLPVYLLFVIIPLFGTKTSLAQSDDSLHVLILKMQRGENDTIRAIANSEFQRRFLDSLNTKGSFDKTFADFKNIYVVKSEDNFFKVYTWTYPNYNGDKYY